MFVSAAPIWEIEIKCALGKLRAPGGLHPPHGVEVGFDALDIIFEHATVVGQLPMPHADPFDRMLIAQAIVEQATIVTADAAFRRYDVAVLEAT